MSNIPQYIEEEKEGLLAIITASFKNNILLSGKLPDALKVFEENRYIVKNINQPGDEKTTFCLVSLAQIINRLQYLGYLHWSKIISDQFQQLDYTKCSERTINYVVPELVSGVLLGADYNLLNPVLATKSLDKRVRKILGIIKERLQYAYPRIPVEYRETLRKILRDIKDIPVPEKRGLFED